MIKNNSSSVFTLASVKEKLLSLKPELIEKYRIKKIGIFGSFSDGTFTRESDSILYLENMIEAITNIQDYTQNLSSKVKKEMTLKGNRIF